MEITPELNELIYRIVGICNRIHNTLGPGFPEENYKNALIKELSNSNFRYETNKKILAAIQNTESAEESLDFIIEDLLVVAVKSEKKLTEVHRMKVMESFQWMEYPAALLVNFGESKLKHERILPPVEMLRKT